MIWPAVFYSAPVNPKPSRGLFVDAMVCAIVAMTMETSHTIAVGTTAPDFSLPDSTGQQRTLSELAKNSQLVLVFYRGHW